MHTYSDGIKINEDRIPDCLSLIVSNLQASKETLDRHLNEIPIKKNIEDEIILSLYRLRKQISDKHKTIYKLIHDSSKHIYYS